MTDLKSRPGRSSQDDPECDAPDLGATPGYRKHASERWTAAVEAVRFATQDPKNLKGWARTAGASVSTLRSWCNAAGCNTRVSLCLARLLRAARIANCVQRWEPYDVLDVVDQRTLKRLLREGGLSTDPHDIPSADTVLGQKWPGLSVSAMQALRTRTKGVASP
jgi:hypothetical protein